LATIDTWDPAQYEKFQREREQPFFDLLGMVRPEPQMRIVDLGCGTGKQTRALHERLQARETIGLDQSPKMLQSQASTDLPTGLHFEVGTIEDFPRGHDKFDLVFSNAALHWVDDHGALLPRLASALGPRGQLAFQVPTMHDEPCHKVAERLAASEPFRSALHGWQLFHAVQTPRRYAQILYGQGFDAQDVRLMIYPHVLPGPEAVVEWMKGTLLTEYARHLPPHVFASFVDRYRALLLEELEPARPFFFPFKRILCWGRKAV
jgi:trans-aconitate 2-methyltransferase